MRKIAVELLSGHLRSISSDADNRISMIRFSAETGEEYEIRFVYPPIASEILLDDLYSDLPLLSPPKIEISVRKLI